MRPCRWGLRARTLFSSLVSSTLFVNSLGTAGVNSGFSPLYQIGGPRSIQLVARLQF